MPTLVKASAGMSFSTTLMVQEVAFIAPLAMCPESVDARLHAFPAHDFYDCARVQVHLYCQLQSLLATHAVPMGFVYMADTTTVSSNSDILFAASFQELCLRMYVN
jgi:hypothetical protein